MKKEVLSTNQTPNQTQRELKEADRLYAKRFFESLPLSGGIFDMISIFLQTALGTSKDEGEKKKDRTPRTSEHDYNNGV